MGPRRLSARASVALAAVLLQGCAGPPAPAAAQFLSTRPQLSDAQARAFDRQAVLGADGWDPLADAVITGDAVPPLHYRVDRRDGAGADGRTRFTSVQAAVLRADADARAASAPLARRYIGIAPGDYQEVVHLPPGAVPITLWGLGRTPADVRIRFALHAGAEGGEYTRRIVPAMSNAATAAAALLPPELAARLARCGGRERIGTFCTAVMTIQRDGTQLRHLLVENTHDEGTGPVDQQAVALAVEGADRVQLEQVHLFGHQDTLYLAAGASGRPGRSFIHRSLVAGDVDFIFGNGTAFFQRSEIRWVGAERGRAGGFIGAPSTDWRTPHGFVFDHCDFSTVPGAAPQRVHLARQWFPGAGCSPYGDGAGRCRIAASDAAALPTELTPSALAAVGKMVVLRSRLGAHIAADEPWAPWQRDRSHRAYRPAQTDSDHFWQRLRAAGLDPAAFGVTRPLPADPYLAEYRNTLCIGAPGLCAAAANRRRGLE